MPKYKVSKVYTIEAESKTAARQKWSEAVQKGTEEELLDYISVREIEEGSFLKKVKAQLTG